LRLGADPSRVVVTGNTKFDQTYTDVSPDEKAALLTEMGLAGSSPVILAGSTHKGEEEIIFQSFTQIKAIFPQAKLVIAPRDIMRADEIINLAEKHNLIAARRTVLQQAPASGHTVVVLDTIGELGKVYSLGDIVFVGGSLIQHGGHNILEPAAHGKPIIVGPNMFNFKDSYFLFSNRGACVTVKDSEELTAQMLRILENDEISKAMSDETMAIITENRGAARKSALYLKELLSKQAS
ncbi:MAG: 3-deoxy-D-manno-octulosonic acid transferase, partial [Negativicutes bacterium]|nr:3-deoxy-D-manno-octulosonic acid transferase [Negativicutes bacterium]